MSSTRKVTTSQHEVSKFTTANKKGFSTVNVLAFMVALLVPVNYFSSNNASDIEFLDRGIIVLSSMEY